MPKLQQQNAAAFPRTAERLFQRPCPLLSNDSPLRFSQPTSQRWDWESNKELLGKEMALYGDLRAQAAAAGRVWGRGSATAGIGGVDVRCPRYHRSPCKPRLTMC